jgi:galactose oxidase
MFVQIFNPPYLFATDGSLATRPTIKLSSAIAKYGDSLQVTSSEPLMMISMIRMSTATHSSNTDQRRLELCGPSTVPCGASPVTVTIDEDPGIALAGNWMFFGVNAQGVPSVASTVLVG